MKEFNTFVDGYDYCSECKDYERTIEIMDENISRFKKQITLLKEELKKEREVVALERIENCHSAIDTNCKRCLSLIMKRQKERIIKDD